jgi:hypothetical protein
VRYFLTCVVVLGACAAAAEEIGQGTEWVDWSDLDFTESGYIPPPDYGLPWHYDTPEWWVCRAETGADPASDQAPCPAEAGWHYATIDGGDDLSGFCASLEFDSNGYPCIAHAECRYYIRSQSYLKYLRWTGSEWVEELKYWGESGAGPHADLELDENDLPHIAYGLQTDDPDNWHLGYSYFDGEEWHHEVVDNGPVRGTWASLELDSQGHPHIAYGEYYGGLWYAYHDGGSWILRCLDNNPGILEAVCSLELDRFDHPHISYGYQFSLGQLRYVHWDGSEWIYEAIGPAQHTNSTSLELDSLDRPHISFCSAYALYYIYYNGSDWEYELVDDYGPAGFNCHIDLDGDDNPWISYHNAGYQLRDLRLAHLTDQGWVTEVVDDFTVEAGYWNSLKLDSDGLPHIAYMYSDDIDTDLRYAWYSSGEAVNAELTTEACDEGVLVGWTVTGDTPAGLFILRSVEDEEPTVVSGALSGSAVRWLDMKVDADVEYRYWLEVTDADGGRCRFGPTEPVALPGPVRELTLSVHPNPASDSVTFEYTLPENGPVTISLYDLAGRRVATLVDGEPAAVRHEAIWDASGARPGVYLVLLDTDSGRAHRRLVVAR